MKAKGKKQAQDTATADAALETWKPASVLYSKDNNCKDMNTVFLKDMVPAARNNINTKFILLDKSRIKMEGQSKTCMALVADETAAVHFQLWGEECEAFEAGDMIRLENGIFSNSRDSNKMVLRAGKRGNIKKIGEFTMAFVETPNMSEIQWAVDPNNNSRFVQKAVLSPHSRVFPPLL
ncbi:SOSS complex subunit B homolog [Linum perenne]